ncbi:hypothetical protein U1Q18_048977 [Sarracenia purpurea var. burkii]
MMDLRNEFSAEIIHATVLKNGSCQCLHGANYLLKLYVQSRHLDHAQRLFDEIPRRDVRTWTIIISGFSQNGSYRLAVDLFSKMHERGVVPNRFTFSSILKCCSSLNELRMGKGIHGWILRYGIDFDVVLRNSMLDLYGKCGAFDYAETLFESMAEKDTVSWNIMICSCLRIGDMGKSLDLFRRFPFKNVATWNTIIDGHVRNGFESIALDLVYEMVEIGPVFNEVTFSIALVLVSSLSLLELGRQIHGRVLRIGIHNDGFVRNSLINLYCKCRQMEKASTVFQNMALGYMRRQNPKIYCDESITGSISWSSMVNGYIQNDRLEEGLKLFNTMVCERIEVDKFTLTCIVSACGNAGLLELGQQIHGHIHKIGHRADVFMCSSMIDICLNMVKAFIYNNGISHMSAVWKAFLSSCRVHKNFEMAKWASEKLLELEPFESGPYILLSNTYATNYKWEEVAKFRDWMKERGVKKHPGLSWSS